MLDFYHLIIKFLIEGGIFIIPIGIVLLIGLSIGLERWFFLTCEKIRNKRALEQLIPVLNSGKKQQMSAYASENTASITHIIHGGLHMMTATNDREEIENALSEGMLDIVIKLKQRISYTAMLANVATLLGLLGTIIGLIGAFSAVASADPAEKSRILSESISIAMNTTAFGIIVAIPLLIIHALLTNKSQNIMTDIETGSVKFLNIMTKLRLIETRSVSAGFAKPIAAHINTSKKVDTQKAKSQPEELIENSLSLDNDPEPPASIETTPIAPFQETPIDIEPAMPTDSPHEALIEEPEPEPEPEQALVFEQEQEPAPEAEKDVTEPEDEPVFTSRTRSRPVEITSARRVPDPVVAPVEPEPSEPTEAADPIAVFTRSAGSAPASEPRDTTALSTSAPETSAIPTPVKETSTAASLAASLAAPVRNSPALHPTPARAEHTEKKNRLAPVLAMFSRSATQPATNADRALQGAKGRRQAVAVGGKPKHLGLILTASLLAVMLIAAMWASSRLENGIAGLFSTPSLVPDVADVADPEPVEPTSVEAAIAPAPAPTTDTAEAAATPQPLVTTIPGTVLSPAEAARIYAATGVWQRAPRLADQAEPSSLDGLLTFAALPTVAPIEKPAGLDLGMALPDQAMLAPINPTSPDRPVQRDARGFILAAENGTILPTGVWIYGRKPAIVPPLRPTPEIIPAAAAIPDVENTIDLNTATSGDIAGVTEDNALAPDVPTETETAQASDEIAEPTANEVVAPDAAPETEVAQGPNSDALPAETDDLANLATDEDAAADSALETDVAEASDNEVPQAETDGAIQEGLAIVAGRPEIVPPLRPGSAPPDESAEAGDLLANNPALASFRPATRPDGLVPPAPFADPALAGYRPSLRPDGLVPPSVEEDVEEDVAEVEEPAPEEAAPVSNDISSIVASIAAAAPASQIVNPTANAIAVSPRPDARPRNFAQVVSSAQTRAARQQTRNEAAATAAAAVPTAPIATAPARAAGPSSTTVAQAATLSNAIRLRDVNLIGVYGRPGDRRALIRLGNGRFVKVEVGSSLDGGRVTAIGDSALNFVKRGQTFSLQLPSG